MGGDEADATVADTLQALGNSARLSLLRQLRTPRTLSEIRVRPSTEAATDHTSVTRQAIRKHLDRLIEAGLVVARPSERDYGETTEYLLNPQALFALTEEVSALARIRPEEEPAMDTVRGEAPSAPVLPGPCLVLVHGLDVGRIFPLAGRGDAWVIGRRRALPVPLDFDPYVSAENTSIVREGGTFFVVDLPDSRNGTTLNLRPIARGGRAPLRHGDVVGVGRSLLLFRA